MSLTKRERAALEELRRKVTLSRAALTPPKRAEERGYRDRYREPSRRPAARETDVYPDTSSEWTNDVAESLKVYTESWVLPVIDALLADDRDYLAQVTGIPLTFREWMRPSREEVR